MAPQNQQCYLRWPLAKWVCAKRTLQHGLIIGVSSCSRALTMYGAPFCSKKEEKTSRVKDEKEEQCLDGSLAGNHKHHLPPLPTPSQKVTSHPCPAWSRWEINPSSVITYFLLSYQPLTVFLIKINVQNCSPLQIWSIHVLSSGRGSETKNI